MPISINGTTGISGVDGSAGTPALQGSDANTGIAFGSDVIIGSTGGTERFRCDSSGRLLVGTSTNLATNQSVKQEIANGNLFVSSFTNDAFANNVSILKSRGTGSLGTVVQNGDELGTINFFGDDGTSTAKTGVAIKAYVDGVPGNNDLPSRMSFWTTADGASSPTERMRIASGGDVLVGTTALLDVGSGTDDGFRFVVPGGAGGIFQCSNNNNAVAYFRRRGTDGTLFDFRKNTTSVGSISITGSATAYNTSSDYRLKENVTAVTDGITRLQQLKPSRFNFKADPGKTVDGFLAHEVQAVVPEAIHGTKDEVDTDGNPIYQGIDQSKLVPLLTAALQEAIAKIESLETRLAALEVTP